MEQGREAENVYAENVHIAEYGMQNSECENKKHVTQKF